LTASGTYKIENNEIPFRLPVGVAQKGRISGQSIDVEDINGFIVRGGAYVKQ
jgi:hypothetical protein